MAMNVTKEVSAMQRMTVKELRRKFAEVFGDETRSGNKAWLIKRIAWRIQANAEGGLSERARQRAHELACDADIRLSPPKIKTATTAATETVTAAISFSDDARSILHVNTKRMLRPLMALRRRTTKISRLPRLNCHIRNRRRQLGCIFLFALHFAILQICDSSA